MFTSISRLLSSLGIDRPLVRRTPSLTAADASLRDRALEAARQEDWETAESLARPLLERSHRGLHVTAHQCLASAAITNGEIAELEGHIGALEVLTEEMHQVLGDDDEVFVNNAEFLEDLRRAHLRLETLDRMYGAYDRGDLETFRTQCGEARDHTDSTLRFAGIQGLATLAAEVEEPDEESEELNDLRRAVASLEREGKPEFARELTVLHRLEALLRWRLGRPDEALSFAERAVEADTTDHSKVIYAIYLRRAGRLEESVAELQRLQGKIGESPPGALALFLAGSLHLAGRGEDAEAVHRAVPAEERSRLADIEAWVAACRGDRDECVANVQRSLDQGHVSSLPFLRHEAEFDPFRADPRFPSEACAASSTHGD